MIASGPLLTPWLTFPLAAVTMCIIALHAAWLAGCEMPESRRRIRRINAMLMLLSVPLIAYAFSAVGSDRPRVFVLVWSACIGMLGVVVLVAIVDMLNTARMRSLDVRQRQRRIARAREALRRDFVPENDATHPSG